MQSDTAVPTQDEPVPAQDERHLLDFDGGDQQTLCKRSLWNVPNLRLAARAHEATCEDCRLAAGLSVE